MAIRSLLLGASLAQGFTRLLALAPAAVPKVYFKKNVTISSPVGLKGGGGCQVLFLDATEDAFLPNGQPLELHRFDAILTDAHDLVPWASVAPPLHFIDKSNYPHQPTRILFEQKQGQRSLSILIPRQPQGPEVVAWTAEALAAMPNDVYFDDGTPESRRPAFEKYAFSVLLSIDSRVPSPALLECVAYAAVPMLVWTVPHFINYTVYFPYAVGKFRGDMFSPTYAQGFLQAAHKDAIYVMQNSLMLVQDFFHYRYSLPFHERLQLHAGRLCEDAALPQSLRTDVFIAIYSAKPNFARRQAARDTWLTLVMNPAFGGQFETIVTSYRFFINALGAGDPSDPASSGFDDMLRAEAEVLGDLVFLEAMEEYPIGNQGRLAFHWIANHTTAPYIFKLDDDMYVRPLPLLRMLLRQQRSMLYWGFFERSGLVVRDPEQAHFLPDDLFGHDGVFPPYARGAALALSLDLVRLIVHFDRRGLLQRLKVEDASYGYFLWQLVMIGATSVTLADRDEAHFSLDPKCCTEQSHPNNCWSPLADTTWLVHHVSPKTVRCMFRTDVEAGYYVAKPAPAAKQRRCRAIIALSTILPGDDIAAGPDSILDPCAPGIAVEPVFDASVYDPKRTTPLPSLCGCVYTPPSHPSQPKPGPLYEGPKGPRLHVDL